ncbi:hypothetical protein AAGO97_27705, partial [Klebsiella pneumoniae]
LRGVRQQQDEPGRFSICSRQAAVVQRVCNEMNINTSFRYHTGYDHSYYFISSFIGEHIAYHANRLRLSA